MADEEKVNTDNETENNDNDVREEETRDEIRDSDYREDDTIEMLRSLKDEINELRDSMNSIKDSVAIFVENGGTVRELDEEETEVENPYEKWVDIEDLDFSLNKR